MFAQFNSRQLIFTRHVFTLSLAENLNEAGLKELGMESGIFAQGTWRTRWDPYPVWQSYRLANIHHTLKSSTEIGYTVVGLTAETPSKQEFSISALDATTANPCRLSIRCEASKDFREWTDLLKKVEDPKLTSSRSTVERGSSTSGRAG